MERSRETQQILDALYQPLPALAYFATEQMLRANPGRHVFVGEASYLDIFSFAAETDDCEAVGAPNTPLDMEYDWRSADHPLLRTYVNGYYHVTWQGHKLEILQLTWARSSYGTNERAWIVADTEEIARAFYRAVHVWATEISSEVLVFHGGCWNKDRELFEDISNFSRENLILRDELKETIWSDFAQFFSAREVYAEHGIPWKRGVLFTGPPGNGKSHAVKALVNELKIPCLYVKSLKSEYSTEHSNIRSVFKRARDTTPCLLVFEDLDSHIHEANRSFFLNELDGFAANEGILTLATSNYPERLDPAILERPSRFDRKYQFNLPGPEERHAYLKWWNGRLKADLRLEEEQLVELSEATEDFSYAYLRELVLSSMMAWIHQRTDMAQLMLGQLKTLSEQMKSGYDTPTPGGEPEEDEIRV